MIAGTARTSVIEDQRYHAPNILPRTYTEEEALDLIESRWRPQQSARAQLERTWMHCLAFLMGNHWMSWDNNLWRFRAPRKGGRFQVREVRNFIRAWYERDLAGVTSFIPRFKCLPNSNDPDDESSAYLSGHLCRFFWDHLSMPGEMQQMATWMDGVGTGVLKVQWDPNSGTAFEAPAVDLTAGGWQRDGQGKIRIERYFEGDLACGSPSPFETYVDPLATCDKDARWVLQRSRRPLAYIDEHWPDLAAYVQPERTGDEALHRQRSLMETSGYSEYVAMADELFGAGEACTLSEYYAAPSRKFPRGRLVITAGDVVLMNTDNPTPRHGIPFIFFRRMLVPGSFWGQTPVENMITTNRNLDRLVSRMLEHCYLFGNATKVLWPNTAGQQPQSSWHSKLGEVVQYGGLQPPTYLAPPALPTDLERQMQQAISDLDEISMVYGPEKGKFQGKMSGAAINLLVEAGFKAKEPLIMRVALGLKRWAQLVLMEAQKNVTEPRMVKIHGAGEQFDVKVFRGADLRDQTDVRVDVDSLMPTSKQLILEEIQILGGLGFINPADPADRALVFKWLREESDEQATHDKVAHRRRAVQENLLGLRGIEIPPPEPFEEQDVHVRVHGIGLNSDEYRALPPEQKVFLREHYDQHMELNRPQAGVTLPPGMEEAMAAGAPQ